MQKYKIVQKTWAFGCILYTANLRETNHSELPELKINANFKTKRRVQSPQKISNVQKRIQSSSRWNSLTEFYAGEIAWLSFTRAK